MADRETVKKETHQGQKINFVNSPVSRRYWKVNKHMMVRRTFIFQLFFNLCNVVPLPEQHFTIKI